MFNVIGTYKRLLGLTQLPKVHRISVNSHSPYRGALNYFFHLNPFEPVVNIIKRFWTQTRVPKNDKKFVPLYEPPSPKKIVKTKTAIFVVSPV